ncbi:MAG: HD domain-containing protein [Acidimicrobiales bacterium]
MTGLRGPASASDIDEVLDLYERWGRENYDEGLSQLDHALQTAALAVADGAPDELVAAALLHDIGHLLDLEAAEGRWVPTEIDLDHESVGARHLAGLFPPSVTGPVALHVRAKRYRTAVDEGYAAGLSEGSSRSLQVQGGPLTPEEVASFEANPGFEAAVALRGWDDGGKVDGLVVAPLASYRELLQRVALT